MGILSNLDNTIKTLTIDPITKSVKGTVVNLDYLRAKITGVKNSWGEQYIEEQIPDDGTQFVLPKSMCDKVALKANGDVSLYEILLGFDEGHFAKGGGLVRIDVDDISDKFKNTFRKRIWSECTLGSRWIYRWRCSRSYIRP